MPSRTLAALVLAAVPALAPAQSLEPGEWEITSTTTSPLLPQGQTVTAKRCVKKEDADNPERWMGRQRQGDCTITPGAKTGDSLSWEMSCPKSNMRGAGTARLKGDAMEGEMRMTGEMQGRKFELHSRMSGRRLGPCAS